MPLRIQYVCKPCLRRYYATSARYNGPPLPPHPPPIGISKLRTRGLISIHGPDAAKYLQGMTTTNIPSLSGGQGAYSAFLSPKGKVLYDVFIYPVNHNTEWRRLAGIANFQPPHCPPVKRGPGVDEPGFFIECEARHTSQLFGLIEHYKLRSKFTPRIISEWEVWAIWDDNRPPVSNPADIGCLDPRAPNMGKRVVLRQGARLGLETGEQIYHLRRILKGVAEGQDEILSEVSIPQESNMDYMGGIDFRKGCYVGQELTIRTHHTGVVRKRILPVQFYLPNSPPPASLRYDPTPPQLAPRPLVGELVNFYTLDGSGKSVGRFLYGIGNVGLALCRLGPMTNLDLRGLGTREEVVVPEYKIGSQPGGDQVRVKAFVPEWHVLGNARRAPATAPGQES